MTQTAKDMSEYLRIHAAGGTLDRLPEGSINALLNKADPESRAYMKKQQAIVSNFRESGGRELPFQEKRSFEDLPLDKHIRAVMAKADTEDMTYRLNERMGTPTTSADAPPDMREILTAAFDAVEGAPT